MPAKSKAQYRLMQGVASGSIKVKGLSKSEAKDYVKKTKSYSALPSKKKKRG
jgi:hypothetical protein